MDTELPRGFTKGTEKEKPAFDFAKAAALSGIGLTHEEIDAVPRPMSTAEVIAKGLGSRISDSLNALTSTDQRVGWSWRRLLPF